MLIVLKQVKQKYKTDKKVIKLSAYIPETGLPDRQKQIKHLLIVLKQVYKTDKSKYSISICLQSRNRSIRQTKTKATRHMLIVLKQVKQKKQDRQKKIIKASAYSPETGLQDRQKQKQ